MGNAIYTTLARQSGLMSEMATVANNIANISTTGFRREGVVFSEYVQALEGSEPSLSMASGDTRVVDLAPGALRQTGGSFDLAIKGKGFFLVDTAAGQRLTRAGTFMPNADGMVVNADGNALLDSGGSPIVIPPGTRAVAVGPDGTMTADGTPLAQVGLYEPTNPIDLNYQSGTLFRADNGTQPAPPGSATIRQGFLEESNVNPVTEIARMISVQRAYELGQTFLDNEDQRIRNTIQTLGKEA